MGKLTISTFLSMDGVMQAPGGPEEDKSDGFAHGGWLVPHFDDALGKLVDTWFKNADAFLLGRRTYDIFAAHWPRFADQEDTVAKALNSRPKYVASRNAALKTDWHNSTVIKGDLVDAVRELKRQTGREIQVHGSGDFAQTLIANNLIDEYRLFVFPVLIGSGKRLFANGTVPATLKLLESHRSTTGVIVNAYEPAGELRHGSFALDG